MKILICSLNGTGYLNPTIGLALDLKRREHHVAIVTDSSCSAQLESLELIRISRGPHDGPSFDAGMWGQPLSAAIQVKHTEYAIDLFKPDVLVGQQLTLGPFIASARRNIPLAILGFATYLWPIARRQATQGGRISFFAHLKGNSDSRKIRRLEAHVALLRQLRTLFHLPPENCDETSLLGDLFMLRSVPQLESDLESLPGRVHLVGPCLWESEETDPELEAWVAKARVESRPIVYVHQGRFVDQPPFWPRVVEALGNSNVQVVASTANMDCLVGQVPPNFFVRQHISHRQILRHVTAAISSANTSSVLALLAAGIPALLIPGGGEQPDVAERCQFARAARCLLPGAVSKERILSELRSLLEEKEIREAAHRLSLHFAPAGNFERASELIDLLARTRKPIVRSSMSGLQASA